MFHSGIAAVVAVLFPQEEGEGEGEAPTPMARAAAWALEECVKKASHEAEKRLTQCLKSVETYMVSKIREWLLHEE